MSRAKRIDEVIQSAVGPVPSAPQGKGTGWAAEVEQRKNEKLSGDSMGIVRKLSKDEREQIGPGRHERADRIRSVLQLTALTQDLPDISKL